MPPLRSVVWMLWSTTASVFSGARTLRPRHAQALERLRARHLVDEMAVDIDEARAARGLDDVVVPDLVVQRARLGHNLLRRPCGREFGGIGALSMPNGAGMEGEPVGRRRRSQAARWHLIGKRDGLDRGKIELRSRRRRCRGRRPRLRRRIHIQAIRGLARFCARPETGEFDVETWSPSSGGTELQLHGSSHSAESFDRTKALWIVSPSPRGHDPQYTRSSVRGSIRKCRRQWRTPAIRSVFSAATGARSGSRLRTIRLR